MSRSRLLARRAGAHRGLLVVVLLLVAAVTAAVGTTLVAVRGAESAITHDGLTSADGRVATLVVTTRLRADPDDARGQERSFQETVGRLFAGTAYRLDGQEVPDDDSDDPFLRWTLVPDLSATGPADLPVLADGAEALGPALLDDDAVSERGVTVTGELGPRAQATAAAVRAASAVTLVPLLLLGLVGLVAVAQVARLLATTRESEVRLALARGASPALVTGAAAAEALVVCVVAAALGGAGAAVWLALGGSRGADAGALASGIPWPAAAVAALAAGTLAVVAGLQARAAAAGRPAELSGRTRRAAAFGTVALTVVAAGVTLWLLRRYGSPLVPTPDGGQTDVAAAAAPALALAAAAVLVVAALGPLARAWAALAARGPGADAVLVARQVSRRLGVVAVPIVLVVLACGSLVLAATYAGTSQRLRSDTALLATGTDVRVVGTGADGVPADVARDLAGLAGVAGAEPVLVQRGSVDHVPLATVALPPVGAADVLRGPDGSGSTAALLARPDGHDPFDGAPALAPGTDALTLGVTGSLVLGEHPAPGAEVDRRLSWAELMAATRGDDRARRELAQLEDSGVELRLWLADDRGRLTGVDVGTLGYDLDGDGDPRDDQAGTIGARQGTQELTVALPREVRDAPAGQRLVGLDLVPTGTFEWRTVLDLAVDTVESTTDAGAPVPTVLEDGAWVPATGLGMEASRLGAPPSGLGARLELDSDQPGTYRAVPAGADAEHLPAVVSAPLADLLDLEVGERTELPVGTSPVTVEVAGVARAVPGAGQQAAALVGLADLQAWQLDRWATVPAPGEVWVGATGARREAGGPAGLARAVGEVAGVPQRADLTTSAVPADGADAAGPVRAAFEVAAAGAVVLAVVGVAAAAVTILRTRRPEVAVLRAVGVPPRAQGAARAAELLVVGLAATAVGLAVGVAVSAPVVPGLAGATLTGATVVPAVVPDVAWSAVTVPGAVLLAGLAGVAVAIRARVVAQARDATYREEVR